MADDSGRAREILDALGVDDITDAVEILLALADDPGTLPPRPTCPECGLTDWYGAIEAHRLRAHNVPIEEAA